MRRLIAFLAFAFVTYPGQATIFAYDSGPVSGSGFETEVLFTFATDVTDGAVSSANGGFTSTGLKLFYGGQQNGSGTFDPQGYLGSVSNNVLTIGFTAPSNISYTSPFGGPPYSGKGAPVTFSGKVAAVPEPSAWLLMLGGFGLVGAMARRRRGVPVPA